MTAIPVDVRHMAIEPRRATTLRAARRRTGVVKLIRLLLLAAIATIAIVVAVTAFTRSQAAEEAAASASGDGPAPMINPRVTGRDERGNPYVVSALSAARADEEAQVVDLDKPKLTFQDKLNPTTHVSADRGRYDREARTLALLGAVKLQFENGYAFETDQALIHLRDGRATGETGIVGRGPMGVIRAKSFEIFANERRVIFSVDVEGRVDQEPKLAPPLRLGEEPGAGP